MMAPDTASASLQTEPSSCPNCGTSLHCGMVGGMASSSSPCWCFTMPHVLPVPVAENFKNPAPKALSSNPADQPGCLCPACLQQLIDSHDSYDSHDLHPTAD